MQDREISPEGYEFQPGTRLAEISLSCMDWLIMDSVFPTFE